MRSRFWLYALLGLVFGVLDWYFLAGLAALGRSATLNNALSDAPTYLRLPAVGLLLVLNYGVWLIPSLPAALYEAWCSQSRRRAALAAALVWSLAMVSYYGYYTFLLLFAGLPQLEFMRFANRHAPTYWADFWPPFRAVILNQFLEWIGIAVLGGALLGALAAHLYLRWRRPRG